VIPCGSFLPCCPAVVVAVLTLLLLWLLLLCQTYLVPHLCTGTVLVHNTNIAAARKTYLEVLDKRCNAFCPAQARHGVRDVLRAAELSKFQSYM
jgi:hypothetical protein